MSCCSLTRPPRSLHGSPAYGPAWRYEQVLEYLRHRRHQADQDGPFILPSTERDSLVRAYFKFRSGTIGLKHAALRYVKDCDDTIDRTAMGSRIKAITVAWQVVEAYWRLCRDDFKIEEITEEKALRAGQVTDDRHAKTPGSSSGQNPRQDHPHFLQRIYREELSE